MNPAHDDELFLQRVLRWQDGSLSAEDLAALEQEMMSSEEKRRLFAKLQVRSLQINEVLRREAYAAPAEAGPSRLHNVLYRFRWSLAGVATAAACLMIAFGLNRGSG